MTIYLSAPISDSLSTTREHFVEYVKPILVAAAMDWDVVEGRREGEVRAALAERIRRHRHSLGEAVAIPFEDTPTSVLEPLRARIGIQDWLGEKGDIIVGRNTWKEYVRGLHEGWLGPMDAPPPPPVEVIEAAAVEEDDVPATPAPTHTSTLATPTADIPAPQEARVEAEEAKTPEDTKPEAPAEPAKPLVTQPYNSPDSYPSSHLPASIPGQLSAAIPIQFPHILGFFKTPIRMWRFLNRRQLADDIGRRTAAAVLSSSRHFHHETSTSDNLAPAVWEQQNELRQEESEWHKSVQAPKEYAKERVWLDEVVIDPRIGERMRKFELTAADEDRAKSIGKGTAGIPGRTGEEEEK
jgi:import inner membrane translocase subunit TIM54